MKVLRFNKSGECLDAKSIEILRMDKNHLSESLFNSSSFIYGYPNVSSSLHLLSVARFAITKNEPWDHCRLAMVDRFLVVGTMADCRL